MKVWPFIFAASRTLDYQFVALPEIFDVHSCGALRDCLKLDEVEPKLVKTASLSSPNGRTLSCVYRSGPIVVGDEVRLDSAGRKLLFAYGLVADALPGTLAQPDPIIDGNYQWFERRLVSFLDSSKSWTPIATKPINLDGVPNGVGPGRFRKFTSPVAILSLVSFLLLVVCGALLLEIRSLRSQLHEAKQPAPAADSDLGKDNPTPSTLPRAPENELEEKGPLTIQK